MDLGQNFLQSATNFIRIIKGRRREQSAAAFGALCFLAATFLKSNPWIPNWKGYAVAPIALTAIGVIAFAYAFRRLWRATHATDLPPVKDRPLVIKGPSAFTPGDGELFRRLGRESELQELMGYVLDNQTPLVVLMGESGAGKTSLLRAGLPHILKDKGVRVHYWEAVPTDSAERLLRAIQEDWSDNGEKKPAKLEDLINPSAEALGAETHVIVLDQFEQLRGRNAVLQLLRRVARESLPPHRLTWVVAFRREYRADWADFIIPENNKRGFYPKEMSLRLFTSEAARDVISQLIQEAGLQVEQPVVNNLISAAANADHQVSPVDLGIGLLVLAELHDRLGGRTLTVKDYQFAGGAEGLLTQYINRCLERFAETEREPLLKALLALRDPETNQRHAEGLPLEQIAAEADTDPRRLQPQLERLAQRDIRLLETVTPKNAGKDSVTHYRLPHERLIPALHRLTRKLLGEIEQARLRFENAFLAWQKNDKRGHYLLKGKDLKLIERNASQMPWGSAEQEKQNYLRQSLRRRGFVRMGAVAAAIALIALGWIGNLQYQRIEGTRYLSYQNYPPELYDYQHQLKKLEMTEPLDLERFTWLSSDSIEELSLKASESSNSIAGLASLADCRSLKKLTLNLQKSQVNSVDVLAQLRELTHLTLDLSESRVLSLDALAKLDHLTGLTLDLSPSQVTDIEALSKLNSLMQLSLDLSNNQVSNLEPLSKLNRLTQLTIKLGTPSKSNLFRDNQGKMTLMLKPLKSSSVNNLKWVSTLSKLTQLDIDVSNSSVGDLEPLSELNGLTQLTLDLSGSDVTNLEPLAKLSNLTQLRLNTYDSQAQNTEPLAKLSKLKQSIQSSSKLEGLASLARNFFTSEGNDPKALMNLNELTQLTLGVYGTGVRKLDSLSMLRNLTQLTLGLRQSEIVDIEPLSKLSNLTQLNLLLGSSFVESIDPLAKLGGLTQLALYLRKSRVSNLQPLAKLNSLTQLTLDLSESQVNGLKSLEQLKGLTQLTLTLNDKVGNLEWLTNMPKMQKLSISDATRAQRMSLQKLPPSVVELSF